MTEFRCDNCKEIHNLSQRAKFCPNCGSTSLNLVVKEQSEPSAKETIGVYTPEPPSPETVPFNDFTLFAAVNTTETLEAEKPRRRSKQS